MAIFVVLWSYLLTIKLGCLQKNKFGHTNEGVAQHNVVNGLEERVKALENIHADFQCPTEKNGYRLIENQCYFFDRINRDYKIAQEKCKTVFGPHFVGKMWEPQSLHINNIVSSEAKSIFGTSVDHRFWIGEHSHMTSDF